MQAGLFGGTFNPIHNGHLAVADQVLRHFYLDRLYVIPLRVPPHKFPTQLAPAADRMRMIQLAIPPDRRYHLSDAEIRREGPSYTIDTVEYFGKRVVPGAKLKLIMGLDAFLEIHTWKAHRRLLSLAEPIVVARFLEPVDAADDPVCRMDDYIRNRLSGNVAYDDARQCWQLDGKDRFHLLPMTPVPVSSSLVRRRIRAAKTIDALVPPAVCAYIERKELYR